MYPCNNNIIDNICKKWFEKGNLIFSPHEVGNSFNRTHSIVDDIYLRYIQFRTLYYRFLTDDIPEKIKIKGSNTCSMCTIEVDSANHI